MEGVEKRIRSVEAGQRYEIEGGIRPPSRRREASARRSGGEAMIDTERLNGLKNYLIKLWHRILKTYHLHSNGRK